MSVHRQNDEMSILHIFTEIGPKEQYESAPSSHLFDMKLLLMQLKSRELLYE